MGPGTSSEHVFLYVRSFLDWFVDFLSWRGNCPHCGQAIEVLTEEKKADGIAW